MLVRAYLRFLVFLVATASALFVSAGTFAWWRGWLFLAILACAVASVTFGIFKGSPELLQERASAGKRAKGWDRVLVPLVTGIPFVAIVVAGLGQRRGWAAPFGDAWALVSAATLSLGAGITYLAMRANRFFSSHVRIQTDRGHSVIQSGAYAVVRHPGYVGAVIVTLSTPVLLNSLAASVLAILTTTLTVLRTWLEDRTLVRELPGYAAYAEKVRWRLLPLVW